MLKAKRKPIKIGLPATCGFFALGVAIGSRFFKKIQDWILIRKNPKMDFAFLYKTDQSKISRIMVHQRNRRINSGNGFFGSFDASRTK